MMTNKPFVRTAYFIVSLQQYLIIYYEYWNSKIL